MSGGEGPTRGIGREFAAKHPTPQTPLEKSEKSIAEMANDLSTMAKNLTEFEGSTIAIQRVIAAMEEIQSLRTKLLRKFTGDKNEKNEQPGENVL